LANSKQAVYSVKVGGNEVDWASLSYAQIPTSSDSNWNAATMDTSKNGYRLPTEMEWMWAAMGADKTAQPNTSGRSKAFAGSDGSNSIDGYVWYSSNSGSKTHEVGKKGANELGLKDMSGNVWEWCWDMYDGTYGSDGTVAATGELTDFTGAASGSIRVLRGGSWFNVASDCVVAYRTDNSPDSPAELVGCRFGCPAQQ
jgi:formylglycine-generating enzyme required for sulfatase activity